MEVGNNGGEVEGMCEFVVVDGERIPLSC